MKYFFFIILFIFLGHQILFGQNKISKKNIHLRPLSKNGQVNFKNNDYILTFDLKDILSEEKQYYDTCIRLFNTKDTLDLESCIKTIWIVQAKCFDKTVYENIKAGKAIIKYYGDSLNIKNIQLFSNKIDNEHSAKKYIFIDKKRKKTIFEYSERISEKPSF